MSALQTRDENLRIVALEQLSKFLDYWTAELYAPSPHFKGLLNGGHDTPQPESWDEVFDVDTELPLRSKKSSIQVRLDREERRVICLFVLHRP